MTAVPDPSEGQQERRTLESASGIELDWQELTAQWKRQVESGLLENDDMIRNGSLEDGLKIVSHRSAVINHVLSEFFETVLVESRPRGATAIYAFGGTGRGEMCPDSDVDLGVFVENIQDEEDFLNALVSRKKLIAEFIPGLGDSIKINSFHDLKNQNHFDLTMLRSLLDAELITGEAGFHTRIQRQCVAQGVALNLELAFDTIEKLRDMDFRHPQEPGDIGSFHVKEGKGGQRNFQLPVWMQGFGDWVPSRKIYELGRAGKAGAPSPEVQEANSVVLFTRCWLALQRMDRGERQSYVMSDQDTFAFSERFGGEGVKKLNASRDAILHFREDVIDQLLQEGIAVPGTGGAVRYRETGLSLRPEAQLLDPTQKFFELYQAAVRFGIPIERSTQRTLRQNVANTIEPHPLFAETLGLPNKISAVLRQWKSLGVLSQVLPHFEILSESFYRPDHRNAYLIKDARAIQRVENLDKLFDAPPAEREDSTLGFFYDQLEALGDEGRIAVRLALMTEEIPDTMYEGGALYEQSVARYMAELRELPGLSEAATDLTEFLIRYKRRVLSSIEQSADSAVLQSWEADIDSLALDRKADAARALALFAFAAFDFDSVDPELNGRLSEIHWKNLRSLCENLIHRAEGFAGDSYLPEYFDDVGRRVGEALPDSLKQGPMLTKVVKRFGEHEWDLKRAHPVIEKLKRVLTTGEPGLELSRSKDSCELAIYGFNQPGLFWKITSVFHEMDLPLRYTELYSLEQDEHPQDELEEAIGMLVVDFITFDLPHDRWSGGFRDQLCQRIHERICSPGQEISDDSTRILSACKDSLQSRLTDLGEGRLKFSFSSDEHEHVLYAVARTLSEQVAADIYSVSEDGTHDWDVPRMNVYFRTIRSAVEVSSILVQVFPDMSFIDSAVGARFQNGQSDSIVH